MSTHNHAHYSPEHSSFPSHELHAAILEELSKAPVYDKSTPLFRFVAERVAFLCSDEIDMPDVYVIGDPSPNACIVGDVMVVNRGLVELMDFQEEFDAVLMHELVHHDEKHAHGPRPKGILKTIGHIRAHETEADVRALLYLDKRSINPRGMSSAFEKMAAYVPPVCPAVTTEPLSQEEEIMEAAVDISLHEAEKRGTTITSPTHGKDEDRALNVEQVAWLLDLKNLSPLPLSPLHFDKKLASETGGPAQADDLLVRQATLLHELEARTSINTARRKQISNAPPPEELASLLACQAKLFSEYDHSLSPAGAEELARAVSTLFTGDWRSFASNYEIADTERLAAALSSPAFVALSRGGLKESKSYLASELFIKAYETLTTKEELGDALTRLQAQFGHQCLEPEVMERLFAGRVDPHKFHNLSRVIAESTVNTQSILMLTEVGKGEEWWPNRLLRHVNEYRYQHAMKLAGAGDTVATLQYLSCYTQDYANSNKEGLEILKYEMSVWADNPDAYQADPSLAGRDPLAARLVVLLDTQPVAELAEQIFADQSLSEDERIAIGKFLSTWFKSYSPPEQAFSPTNAIAIAALTRDYKELQDTTAELLLEVITANLRKIQERAEIIPQLTLEQIEELEANAEQEEETISEEAGQLRESSILSLEMMRGLIAPYLPQMGGIEWQDFIDDTLAKSPLLRDRFTLIALDDCANGNPQYLHELLAYFTPSKIRAAGLFSEKDMRDKAQQHWDKAAGQLLMEPNILEDENHLLSLIALGITCPDVQANLHIPGYALLELIKRKSFSEGLELLFNRYDHLPAFVLHRSIDYLIESGAQTHEDFEALEAAMEGRIRKFIGDYSTEIGVASIVETNVLDAYKRLRSRERDVGLKHDEIRGLESARLLGALLRTSQDDLPLKHYLFDQWWQANRTHLKQDVLEHFEIENGLVLWRYPGKEQRLHWWLKQLPASGTYTPLTETLDKMYLSNSTARFLAIRQLLTGNDGVLEDRAGRESLVDALMHSWLEYEPGSSTHVLLTNLLSSLMDSSSSKELYQYIGPVLQDLILRPPQETASAEKVIAEQAQRIFRHMEKQGRLRNPSDRDVRILTRKITLLAQGGEEKIETGSPLVDQLTALFPEDEARSAERLSPTQLALLAGKKAGALGVRILQFAGQYYEIPAEDREEFSEVYDSMKGQSRLQAYKVLRREAETNPLVAGYLGRIVTFGERLGGGSLFTVYKVWLEDGTTEALGVRNPNAEYHLIRIADMMHRTLDKALCNDPHNTDLFLAKSLVDKAVALISAELNDVDFDEKDALFRQQNSTLSPTADFKKGNARYDVYVPQSKPTGTPHIRRDEFVDGKTLNSLTINEGPTDIAAGTISLDDFREVISLQTRNLIYQLRAGALGHSDMHVGNFSITNDNTRMAVFDRHNLIPITPELRATMREAMKSIATGDRAGAIRAVLQHATGNAQENIEATIASVAQKAEQEPDVVRGMSNAIIEIQRSGLEISDNLSLLLRNLFCQSELAKKAGFNNVVECFLHTADDEEINELMRIIAS